MKWLRKLFHIKAKYIVKLKCMVDRDSILIQVSDYDLKSACENARKVYIKIVNPSVKTDDINVIFIRKGKL